MLATSLFEAFPGIPSPGPNAWARVWREQADALLASGVVVPVAGPIKRVQERIDNLLTVAERFDHPGGSKHLARRARDKAAGMETALRLLEPACDWCDVRGGHLNGCRLGLGPDES